MKYFVIKNKKSKTTAAAVVFHDTTALHYIIRSNSEAFRKAFEASVRFMGSTKLVKDGNKLSVSHLGLESDYWAKSVLDKACGSHWEVIKQCDFSLDDNVDSIIKKYLS